MAEELKSGVILNEGEELVMEIEAEMWADDSNKIVGKINKFISALLGTHIKGFVVITNQRIIEVEDQISWYVFHTARRIRYVIPSSIMSVTYSKEPTLCCFCSKYELSYRGLTSGKTIRLQSYSDEDAQKIVDVFYKLIVSKQ